MEGLDGCKRRGHVHKYWRLASPFSIVLLEETRTHASVQIREGLKQRNTGIICFLALRRLL